MPLIEEAHDSLPYIEPDVTEKERAQINRIIAAEIPLAAKNGLHPSIISEPDFRLSELMSQEVHRKAQGSRLVNGIDLSRYEAPEAPSEDTDVVAWKESLRTAYASSAYLSGRVSNLTLLEDLGKNAWLTANSQLEYILWQLEKELEEVKSTTETVNKARKAAQEDSQGEITGLEETWKRGIGRILEVEVAVEEVRQQILRKRRQQAG